MANSEHIRLIDRGKNRLDTWQGTHAGQTLDLTGVDFSGRDLTEFNLSGADLSGANLAGATLRKAKLDGANLTNAIIEDAKLQESSLLRATLINVKGERAHLERAVCSEMNASRASFRLATFTHAKADHALFSGADFSDATVHHAIFDYSELHGVRMKAAKATAAQFSSADLTGADLSNADLSNVVANGACFRNVNASHANFLKATLNASDFSDATLTKAHCGGITAESALFRAAQSEEADFTDGKLRGAVFSHSRLRRASFHDADMSQCDVTGADMYEALLTGTTFTGLIGASTVRHLETVKTNGSERYFESVVRRWHERYCDWEWIRTAGNLRLFAVSYSLLVYLLTSFVVIGVYNQYVEVGQMWAAAVLSKPDPSLFAPWDSLATQVNAHVSVLSIPTSSVLLLLATVMLVLGSWIYGAGCPAEVKQFSRVQWCHQLGHTLIHYWALSWKHPVARLACAALYGVGGLMFVGVTVAKIWQVTAYIWKYLAF